MTKLDSPEKPLTLESTFELLNISGRQWLHHLFWIEICPQQVNTWINNQQVNTWNNNQQINTWNNEKQVNTWNSRRQIIVFTCFHNLFERLSSCNCTALFVCRHWINWPNTKNPIKMSMCLMPAIFESLFHLHVIQFRIGVHFSCQELMEMIIEVHLNISYCFLPSTALNHLLGYIHISQLCLECPVSGRY